MNTVVTDNTRVLSGMRPTGLLHLGHYHGVLKNWVKMQHEYHCFFFVADWHALTTEYGETRDLEANTHNMVIDWLAAGVDPHNAVLFVQSRVPEHAELHLLLSMITPLGWLERVPTYKEQQEALKEKDLATYGFLGYPLLQSADILMYKAGLVPVGEDQVAHVEMTREVARRFNHVFGWEPDFEEKAAAATRKMGKKSARLYEKHRRSYQEQGDADSLEVARALVLSDSHLSVGDKERLLGYLEGTGLIILPEPQSLLTETPKMPGLDGRKMSKSYGNTITLRETPAEVEQKIRTMPTDPARVRRTDPGNPEKCPVWPLHGVYSSTQTREWVQEGCTSAGIGCLDCKKPVIDAVVGELAQFQERADPYLRDASLVTDIINDGCEAAREVARETMDDVRQAIGLIQR